MTYELSGNESGDDLARLYLEDKISLALYFFASKAVQLKVEFNNSCEGKRK